MDKIVIDCTTGEQSEVPLTAEEVAQREADAAAAAEAEAARAPVEQARAIRDDRSEAVASPTAQLLDAVAFYLDEERSQPEPDARWVTVLEALRQLGLKGVADEAVEHNSPVYAEIYNARVGQ